MESSSFQPFSTAPFPESKIESRIAFFPSIVVKRKKMHHEKPS